MPVAKMSFCLMLVVMMLSGCSGKATTLAMNDRGGKETAIDFPAGTTLGGASKEQASALAQLFVESHNQAMQGFAGVQSDLRAVDERTRKLEAENQKMAEAAKKNLELAESSLKKLTDLAKAQGTGEITLFFPVGKDGIKSGSLEYARLVNFADYLAQESRGRKILFITIGSASATGNKTANERLAKNRSGAPAEVLDKYLVNIPHSYYKSYGTGDLYSPKDIAKKDHERYQHVRIVAVYDTEQLPQLPAGS